MGYKKKPNFIYEISLHDVEAGVGTSWEPGE
jgi:hypothetical protein